ncbi:MAG: alpha/beta hydrolase, partial [Solirubrobacterales bacterium]|nr:alpha/beta hydrolase [Solirubrobacterales bacterium]
VSSAADPTHIVLLAHGYGEHAGRYEHVIAALVAGGAAVYAPDHTGHGRSGGQRALVDDVEVLVQDLLTVEGIARDAVPERPVVLIGHSMGGLVAARYAQQHADGLAGLVLSGPAVGDNPDLLALVGMDPIPEVPIDPAALSRDPAVGEAYAADELVYHGGFARETLMGLGAAIEAVAAGPSLGALPTLWIHGEEDPIVPLAHTRTAMEHLGGSELSEKIYPGARHELFNETNRDEVIGDVVAFVARTLLDLP